jgi:hypothetical protein
VTHDRDSRIRAAAAAEISKHRIHQLTGIATTTVDRVLVASAAGRPSKRPNDH